MCTKLCLLTMLEPLKYTLAWQRIVLASTSPRRREILRSVGLKFEICPSQYEEDLDPNQYESPSDFVLESAFNKANEVAARLKAVPHPPDLIIGADTIVSLDGKVFGKPKSKEMALEMLQQLSGREHTVYTGVVLITRTSTVKFYESTKVFVGELTAKIMRSYVDTGEPMDKAGAYGIQGIGGSLIEKIEGDYYNVMGLPLHTLCKHIVKLNEEEPLPP